MTDATDPLVALYARLRAADIIDTETLSHLTAHQSPPWWLAALQGLAAWIASLFILSSFFVPLTLIGDGAAGRAVCGLVLGGCAIYLFRKSSLFFDQMALALSLAAQALVVFSIVGEFDDIDSHYRLVATFSALVATVMLIPRSTETHRTLCVLIALISLGIASHDETGTILFALLVCAAAVALWLTRTRWCLSSQASRLKASAIATTLLALPAPWLIGPITGQVSWVSSAIGATSAPPGAVFSGGTALLLIGTALTLTRTLRNPAKATVLACALGLSLLAYQAPGLVICCTLFLATYHACHRPLAALSLATAVFYLGVFYYSLHATLIVKSAVLAATGLLLLGIRYWMINLKASP